MAGVAGRYWSLVIGDWESRQRRLFKKESVAAQRHPKLFTFHFSFFTFRPLAGTAFHFSLSGFKPEPLFTSAWSDAPC
jgi:hypothetical protein